MRIKTDKMTHTSYHRIVLLLTLVVFLMNLSAHSFNAKLLAHELEHAHQTISAHHDDLLQLSANDRSAPAAPLSNTEHQLLHAAEHAQPLMISLIFDSLPALPVATLLLVSRLLVLPPAQFDPPFRPPRTISLV